VRAKYFSQNFSQTPQKFLRAPCFVMHVLCVYVSKLLSGYFWLFLGQGLAFLVKTDWQPGQDLQGAVWSLVQFFLALNLILKAY